MLRRFGSAVNGGFGGKCARLPAVPLIHTITPFIVGLRHRRIQMDSPIVPGRPRSHQPILRTERAHACMVRVVHGYSDEMAADPHAPSDAVIH
jgi:hypothetical protein